RPRSIAAAPCSHPRWRMRGAASSGWRRAGAAITSWRRLPAARRPTRVRRAHLVARLAGDGRPTMILGHFDTVWPVGTLARMPLHRDGDRLHGPGVFPRKAGIASALTAVRALEATGTPHTPIVMLWTADEEIGSASSRALIEAEARNCGAVLVMEPALPGGA